jgi:hypothetical protein
MKTLQQRATAAGFAGAMFFGAVVPGWSAPVMTNTAVLKSAHAEQSDVIDVRSRGRTAAGIGIGLAAGALVGAAIANSNRGYYYGDPYYARGYGYNYGYAPPPPPPVYYAEPEPFYEEPAVVYAPAPRQVYSGAYSGAYAAPIDPNGPQRRCWVATDRDRGFGYWGVC